MSHFYTLSGENHWRLDSGLDCTPPLPPSSFRHPSQGFSYGVQTNTQLLTALAKKVVLH